MANWNNWSGLVRCQPKQLAMPANDDELRQVINHASQTGDNIRITGSGHSFSALCETNRTLLSLDNISGIVSVDKATNRVRVRAGTKLGALNTMLSQHGLAMENLGDIDVQSIAGALCTGTHGTGATFGNLATQITGMRLMLANGESLWLSETENPEWFRTARINLGVLGVVTEYELQCVPAYNIHYRTFKANWDDTLAKLEEYRDTHRNFECYWFPYTECFQVKFMDVTDEPSNARGRWFQDVVLENGALWALCQVARMFPSSCAKLCQIEAAAVPKHDQIAASHEIYATTRSVRFQESEYSIPAENLPEVLTAIRDTINKHQFAVNFPLEIRYVKGDNIPLSPAYGRDSAYIAMHMYHAMPYREYFAALTEILDAHQGRPHWGKWHDKTAAQFANLYPEWNTFTGLRDELDPNGVFLNEYLRKVLGVK